MGGGVGKVLSGVAGYAINNGGEFSHKMLLLEQPKKKNFLNICRRDNVDIVIAPDAEVLNKEIERADIVQLEWWHHPLMCKLLSAFPNVSMRLCIWSHIAGTYYPYIKPDFLRLPHKFMFTSACSLTNPYWPDDITIWAKKNCPVVYSSGGFSIAGNLEHIKNRSKGRGFCIGYIGTQDFSKLNPNFIDYCVAAGKSITDSEYNFRMVGDNTNKETLLLRAKTVGLEGKFNFVGYTDDVNIEFAKMDVFGYLLNPQHFGTTENVLLEAMAAGLPVICLEQGAEKCLIQHKVTGMLVKNPKEYGECVRYLRDNPDKRARLGNNAQKYVKENFSVAGTVAKLDKIYHALLHEDKKKFSFSSIMGKSPYEFFLSGLPPVLLENFHVSAEWPYILRGKNKSSLLHFSRVYPEDEKLAEWRQELIGQMDAFE